MTILNRIQDLHLSKRELYLVGANLLIILAVVLGAMEALSKLGSHLDPKHFSVAHELAQGVLAILAKFLVMTLGLGYLWVMFRGQLFDLYKNSDNDSIKVAIIIAIGLVAGFTILGFMAGGIY